MKLIYKTSKKEVKVGDKIKPKGGDRAEASVEFFREPRTPASEGKVVLKTCGSSGSYEAYVSVIGAEWIEREDRLTTYKVEHTDTFGGDANYAWCVRKEMKLDDKHGNSIVIREAKKLLGLSGVRHRKEDMGDTIRLDLVGLCQVVFITAEY